MPTHKVICVPDRGAFKVRVITAGPAALQSLAHQVRKVLYRTVLPFLPTRWALVDGGLRKFLNQVALPPGAEQMGLGPWVALSYDMKAATDRFPHYLIESINDAIESNLTAVQRASPNWVAHRSLSGPQKLNYGDEENEDIIISSCGNLMGTAPSWSLLNLFNYSLFRIAWSIWSDRALRRRYPELVSATASRSDKYRTPAVWRKLLQVTRLVIGSEDELKHCFGYPRSLPKFNTLCALCGDDLAAVCPLGVAVVYELLLELANGRASPGKHYIQPFRPGSYMLLAEEFLSIGELQETIKEIESGNFDMDNDIVFLTRKERELGSDGGRTYCSQTFRQRLQQTVCEGNIKKSIFPYFPQQTMSDSELAELAEQEGSKLVHHVCVEQAFGLPAPISVPTWDEAEPEISLPERYMPTHKVICVPDRGAFKVRVITAGPAALQSLAHQVRKVLYRTVLPFLPTRRALVDGGLRKFLNQVALPPGAEQMGLGPWVALSYDMKAATDRFPHYLIESINDAIESNLTAVQRASPNWVAHRSLSGPQKLNYGDEENEDIIISSCGNLMGTAPSWSLLNLFNYSLFRIAWSIWSDRALRRRAGNYVRFFTRRATSYPARQSGPSQASDFVGLLEDLESPVAALLPLVRVPVFPVYTGKPGRKRIASTCNALCCAFISVWPSCQFDLTANVANCRAMAGLRDIVSWVLRAYGGNGEAFVAKSLKGLAAWLRFLAGNQLHAKPPPLLRFPFSNEVGEVSPDLLFRGSIANSAKCQKSLLRFSRFARALPAGGGWAVEISLREHRREATSCPPVLPALADRFFEVVQKVTKDKLEGLEDPGFTLSSSACLERTRA
ncbi:unnamed protein product [Phyllotreta striolata]|uniref:RdRp catalytic domain-containing protein n=1 Tax=Phyllotreta striolata TaxID=444603 RepID=A0A9P0GXZ4_PHYSR|nr:unnamed protein product [Phyllotreta striolata]